MASAIYIIGFSKANNSTLTSSSFNVSRPSSWTDSSSNNLSGNLTESGGDDQSTIYASNLVLGSDGQLHPDNAATYFQSDNQYGAGGETGSCAYTFQDAEGDTLTGTLTESGSVGNNTATWINETWNGQNAFVVTSGGATAGQTVSNSVGYNGSGPSVWTDSVGDHLFGTATDKALDKQKTVYSYSLHADGSTFAPTGTATDDNSALYTYAGTGEVFDVFGNIIGEVNEHGSVSTNGNSNVDLSNDGNGHWNANNSNNAGSAGETDDNTRSYNSTEDGVFWADKAGGGVTGLKTDSGSEVYHATYAWDLGVVDGSGTVSPISGNAQVTDQSVDTVVESGSGPYNGQYFQPGVTGTENANRSIGTTRDDVILQTYVAGGWESAGSQETNEQDISETGNHTAAGPYDSDGYQQFSGDWTASSELSDTSTMPSGSNSWTLSSVNGDSSYDGDSDWGYYFTKADESNLPDGYVRSTDSESGEISTVFEFGMSASLDDGTIAWTGTGGANTDTVTDDNYLYNSRQITDTAVNGSATDYQQDYDETVNTDYDSDIGTNYSLLPNGQWEAISVNSSNDGTAYAVGTYDIGQTETNPDGTEDIVIDHVVQSYNYFYSGDAHESWDAQGDPTISSGTGGGGTATGAQTFRETNDSPEGGQSYSSQTFAYTQSWSKQYTTDDGESDVIRENNDRDYGAVIIDPYGSVSSITRHYATSDSGFDNGYADLGLFARNGPFTSYSKGFWSSDVQPPLSPWAGYAESGLASNVTPTAFTPMGGISNASPNIIQPTTNVPMPAPAGHGTGGSPAGPSQASAPAAPSTSFWSYLPGALLDTTIHTEPIARTLDGINNIVYLASNGAIGNSNQNLSKLSQLQASGQTSVAMATLSTLPVIGTGYNAVTGTDALTGQPLSGWERAGAVLQTGVDVLLITTGGEGETTFTGEVPEDVPTPSAAIDEAADVGKWENELSSNDKIPGAVAEYDRLLKKFRSSGGTWVIDDDLADASGNAVSGTYDPESRTITTRTGANAGTKLEELTHFEQYENLRESGMRLASVQNWVESVTSHFSSALEQYLNNPLEQAAWARLTKLGFVLKR